ncbi:lytic transglycosylase [Salmonella enterica subsp. enterica serovar Saintpaul]|nr:lytic transglycosylase [Salmonella enterica subsp. enterica serovar Saintpaul]
MLRTLLLFLLLTIATQADAFCFRAAGQRYHIDPVLLEAIAIQESHMNPRAVNENRRNGRVTSVDYGVMQINSTHISELVKLGVIRGKEDLLNNACLNVQVGAWILARIFQTCDVNWQCLGSYNAGFTDNQRRLVYARKIFAIYQRLRGVS